MIHFVYGKLQESKMLEELDWRRTHGHAYGMDHKDLTATRLHLA